MANSVGPNALGKVSADCDIELTVLADTTEPIFGQVFKADRLLGEDAVYAALPARYLINTADFVITTIIFRTFEEVARRVLIKGAGSI